ncbi:unnamed protein product [Paramecium pentaurelia]|uniref:Protein arginine N-methyltransferase domain-containing protein n=1 Tax=Paramecium pentaurelia TaxID=43138 RepID=A0A8S1VZI6_9CILI|nr:unnamed protein product [Paramecium pentaurelia]
MDCNNFLNDEDILKDQNRIQPFVNAITLNKHLFKDKVILDLNAGLGLLPILLSKSGAKHIFAMKAHDHTQKILEQNKISNVTIHKKSIKEVELDCKVDVIISAWMGNMLFYRGNIQELITARDKYLNKDGLILPDKGQLFLQSIEDGEYREQKLTFWDSVYGVNMKWMKRWVIHEPLLESIKQDQLNSDPVLIYEVDLMKCTLEDLSFSNSYQVKINRQDFVTGVIVWMKYSFTFTHLPINVIMGPSKSPFWKPIILYFNEEIPASKDDKLKGSLAMKFISEDLIDIKLSVHTKQYHQIQYFRLN